jgi:hypothetical protein
MSLAADRSLGQIGDRSRGTASGWSREPLAAALQVCSGERRSAAAGGGAVWSSASICECPGLSLLRHRALGVQPHRVDVRQRPRPAGPRGRVDHGPPGPGSPRRRDRRRDRRRCPRAAGAAAHQRVPVDPAQSSRLPRACWLMVQRNVLYTAATRARRTSCRWVRRGHRPGRQRRRRWAAPQRPGAPATGPAQAAPVGPDAAPRNPGCLVNLLVMWLPRLRH